MKSQETNYNDLMAIMKEIAEQSKETDKKIRELTEQSKQTDIRLNKLQGLFTTQWGKLVESMVAPACLNLFMKRGIDVSDTQKNRIIKIGGIKKAEYDVILANGTEVVIVEVKTTLKVEHVNYFLEKLSEVKTWIKSYSEKRVYGAIAAISFDESSDNYAIKKGLFVIKNSGEGILSIDNEMTFKPKAF